MTSKSAILPLDQLARLRNPENYENLASPVFKMNQMRDYFSHREPLPTSYRLILGRYALDIPEPSEEQAVDIRTIILHPQYDRYTYDYDIALLRLDKEAIITDHVVPGCLPGKSRRFSDGQMCEVTGWGLTEGTVISRDNLALPMIMVVTFTHAYWQTH